MAKQKPPYAGPRDAQESVANTLSDSGSPPPPILGDDSGEVFTPSVQPVPVVDAVVARPPLEGVTLAMPPLLDQSADMGYAVRHVDLQLAPRDAMQLKRLVESLKDANCRLKDSSRGNPHVRTSADAIRWLIQQLPTEGLA